MSKVSLGDVCIMEFYRRFENVILTHFITFITTIFLKYSSRLPLGSKNNWVCQISQKNLERRPKDVLAASQSNVCIMISPRTSVLNIIQSTLLLYNFQFYSSNVLRKILKSYMLHILTGFEKRSSDALKTNQKDVRRVMYLRRPQNVNFESLVQMHSHCIIFKFVSPHVCLQH